jgi:uncharacterized protein
MRAMPTGPARTPTLDDLRRYAVSRSFFKPSTLPRALERLGFVQADPIRAPARAQDLTLRHRVSGYRAGDLERRYRRLAIEEDFFINYGFVTQSLYRLMHPRTPRTAWSAAERRRASSVLAFVRERGTVHPREVDAAFQQGKSRNWFGGSSNASTQLLDSMHYHGWLRVTHREGGTRCFAVRADHPAAPDPDQALDTLLDVLVRIYAPLPSRSLSMLTQRLRYGAPQWADLRADAGRRARQRLPSVAIAGERWFWPEGENPQSARHTVRDEVRLLAPFDPLVWDRTRFEAFWGWAYRFEAYTPPAQRVRGYYALPLLWRDHIIGWANVSLRAGQLVTDLGYVNGTAPPDPRFDAALEAELARMAEFLSTPEA